ncbi:unnamed protein product [Rhizoctonia solani]|uniref:Uncharacterized protein n=1 Tax=Rhizoctonia solani TaxID=456999 RepID=A0A8H3D118_9AGAM|nr:unnamed protein product [Rhizoctonia solani]CAE6503280.1 unnamed protein product [Rhizoctonia solani]
MKSILALLAGFVMLAPAVLASPTPLERRCSGAGGQCGDGYMLADCCTGRCDYSGAGTVDYGRGKMMVGNCIV